MTFYRVALQVNQTSTYQWKSTVLSSLETVFGWLRMHRALPQERLRVFSSLSREGLDEQLARENQGGAFTSVTAVHFLQERGIGVCAEAKETPAQAISMFRGAETLVVAKTPSRDWRSSNMGQVVIMTPITDSRCQHLCRKPWPG